jgi:hypothetical protein
MSTTIYSTAANQELKDMGPTAWPALESRREKRFSNPGLLDAVKKTLVLIYVIAILGYAIVQPWISRPIIDFLKATGISCQSPTR